VSEYFYGSGWKGHGCTIYQDLIHHTSWSLIDLLLSRRDMCAERRRAHIYCRAYTVIKHCCIVDTEHTILVLTWFTEVS
jgi:hypothetical protein